MTRLYSLGVICSGADVHYFTLSLSPPHHEVLSGRSFPPFHLSTFPPSKIPLSAFYSTFPQPFTDRSTYIYGGRICITRLAGGLPAVILNLVRDDLRMMARKRGPSKQNEEDTMKVNYNQPVLSYSGHCDGLIYYYHRRLKVYLARAYARPRQSGQNDRVAGCENFTREI